MRVQEFQCSRMLQSFIERGNINPAKISNEAGVPSEVISDFIEYGDFRHTSDPEVIARLLVYLQRERDIYLSSAFLDFSNDEILTEIRRRLEAG